MRSSPWRVFLSGFRRPWPPPPSGDWNARAKWIRPAPRFCLGQNACTAQKCRPNLRGSSFVRYLKYLDSSKRNTSQSAGVFCFPGKIEMFDGNEFRLRCGFEPRPKCSYSIKDPPHLVGLQFWLVIYTVRVRYKNSQTGNGLTCCVRSYFVMSSRWELNSSSLWRWKNIYIRLW